EQRRYDPASWLYRGQRPAASADGAAAGHEEERAGHDKHGAHTASGGPLQRDDTLEDPLCVYQVLRRHFARYDPDLVERACVFLREQFLRVAETFGAASGPERTGAVCYAVGWTQHSVGVQ